LIKIVVLLIENKKGEKMKHVQIITKKPAKMQVSNFQAWKDFLVKLTDQIVEFIFILTS